MLNDMYRYWVLHLSTSKACLEDLVFGLWQGSWFPQIQRQWRTRSFNCGSLEGRRSLKSLKQCIFSIPQCTGILWPWEYTEYFNSFKGKVDQHSIRNLFPSVSVFLIFLGNEIHATHSQRFGSAGGLGDV